MSKAIGVAACLSLLILQLTGAHGHIGAEGYLGVPEISYSHDHGGHDHHQGHRAADALAGHGPEATSDDHEDAQDVSFLDETLPAFKIPMALLALIVLFVVFPRARMLASVDVIYPVLSGRYTRWRPPLRAPPLPA